MDNRDFVADGSFSENGYGSGMKNQAIRVSRSCKGFVDER